MTRVSVIVPVYNVQDYLGECMESILGQTMREIEVICVNDGSTDRSPEILRQYAERDSRVRIIDKENTGYGDSMNRGLSLAAGEYVGIVEPDDCVEPSMFGELYRRAEEDCLDWVKGDFRVFVGDREGPHRFLVESFRPDKKGLYNRVLDPMDHPELVETDNYHWRGIYRKGFLEGCGIRFNDTPGAAYQDNGFKYQTICLAGRVMFVDKAYYWYRRDNLAASSYNPRGLEMMYGEYAFIRAFLAARPRQEEIFLKWYYIKFYTQFHDQLEKVLDTEWEDPRARETLQLYREAFRPGFERGFYRDYGEWEWVYRDVALLLRYPRTFFETKKMERELRDEKYRHWLDHVRDRELVIVCCGKKARQVASFLEINHVSGVAAVCDNSPGLAGTEFYGHTVVSPGQAVERVPGGYFLIARAGQNREIVEQLVRLGVAEDCIESVTVPLDDYTSLTCRMAGRGTGDG